MGAWRASEGFQRGYLFGHLKRHLKFYSDGRGPQSTGYLPASLDSEGWDRALDVGRSDCPDMPVGVL